MKTIEIIAKEQTGSQVDYKNLCFASLRGPLLKPDEERLLAQDTQLARAASDTLGLIGQGRRFKACLSHITADKFLDDLGLSGDLLPDFEPFTKQEPPEQQTVRVGSYPVTNFIFRELPPSQAAIGRVVELSSRLEDLLTRGEQAKEELVIRNQRLVLSIAGRYTWWLPLPDLFQEGCIGLMGAVEKYDYQTGYKLSTYATWWIRQAVTRAIVNKAKMIRLPMHMAGRVYKVVRAEGDLGTAEIEPTATVVAQQLGWTEAEVTKTRAAYRKSIPESLDWFRSNIDGLTESGGSLYEIFPDRSTDSLDETVSPRVLRTELAQFLDSSTILTSREKTVLRRRFGIPEDPEATEDSAELTLQQISEELGCSKERVRQIEAEALEKLRALPNIEALRLYLK